MSESENPPAARMRGRKAGVVPEIDLPPSQVREIVDLDAAPETANPENPAPRADAAEGAPAQPATQDAAEGAPVRAATQDAAEGAPAQPATQDAAATPPGPAAPSARISALVLALFAGLVGGGAGSALFFAARSASGIEAGREAVTARLSALDAALAAAKAREDELKAEIAALGTRIAGTGGQIDIAALETRTTALGQLADALGSRLDKLEGEAQPPPPGGGALQPKLDSLEKAVAALNERLGKGEGRDMLALANGRVAAQGLLDEAFAAALPYAEPLDLLARTGANADLISLARPFAESGAPSAKTLREEFLALKTKPPAAAAAEQGALERAGRALRALVQIRQLGETGDKGDEAALNRVDRALVRGDLAKALAAGAELSPAAAPAYALWRARLEARIRAGEAVSQLRRQAQAALASAASQK